MAMNISGTMQAVMNVAKLTIRNTDFLDRRTCSAEFNVTE